MKTINHNNSGKKYFVEGCQKIHVDVIVREARRNVVPYLIQESAEINGVQILLTGKPLRHGGKRLWFVCPLCGLAVGVIYKHPVSRVVGCRHCLNLEYRCRARKGMAEKN